MNLWEQLLCYASSAMRQRPPGIRRDLWESAEQAQQLRIVVEKLTAEVEQLKQEFESFRSDAEQEIARLRMKVEVLETSRAQERVKRSVR